MFEPLDLLSVPEGYRRQPVADKGTYANVDILELLYSMKRQKRRSVKAGHL